MRRNVSVDSVRALTAAAVIACPLVGRLSAQTEYRNTDAGHPLRVEDATPTERFAFDLHFPSARIERFDTGENRLRVEPALAYGILPRTALEARATFVYREAGASPRGGMAGLGVSLVHALNTETTWIPGVALAGEFFGPMGSARAGGPAYSIRALVTRGFSLGRLHANATYGSYNVTMSQQPAVCVPDQSSPLLDPPCVGSGTKPKFIPDGPCTVSPSGADSVSAARCIRPVEGSSSPPTTPATTSQKFRGAHWGVGVGGDHTFPKHSILVMADAFGELYNGLFDRWDWTAEVGARHQLTPSVTLEGGLGRRVAGSTRAWIVTAGLTCMASFPNRR